MIGRPGGTPPGRPITALNRVGRHFGYSSSSHGNLAVNKARYLYFRYSFVFPGSEVATLTYKDVDKVQVKDVTSGAEMVGHIGQSEAFISLKVVYTNSTYNYL